MAAVVARYAEGAAAHVVAAEFGMGSSTVMRLVREAGLRVHGTWPDEATLAIAASRYADGLAVADIASELGFNRTTLLRAMKAGGIEMRVKGRRTQIKQQS
jgi:AraC-like DNA-binding protein